jgi:hypothetical protein
MELAESEELMQTVLDENPFQNLALVIGLA